MSSDEREKSGVWVLDRRCKGNCAELKQRFVPAVFWKLDDLSQVIVTVNAEDGRDIFFLCRSVFGGRPEEKVIA